MGKENNVSIQKDHREKKEIFGCVMRKKLKHIPKTVRSRVTREKKEKVTKYS